MNALFGWALAGGVLALGSWQYGWRGALMAASVIVFWLLLQFGRSLRVLRSAAGRPTGTVDSAVMFQARLRVGLTLMRILPLAGSLGTRLAESPETWAWQDGGGDRVELVLQGGRLQHWRLRRRAGGVDQPGS